jgi:hypothetical protein
MTSMPWIHAPIAHQFALSNFNSPMPPASGFNAPAVGGASPIHEKVTPRHIGSQVHSAVKSPGISDTGGAPSSQSLGGSNTVSTPAMGLGQL